MFNVMCIMFFSYLSLFVRRDNENNERIIQECQSRYLSLSLVPVFDR